MKALFLVNARSGSNRRRDVSSIIRSSCTWSEFELASCERKEDLDGIVDDAQRAGVEVIFAVGGDGTVHEVAKRLIGRPLALGVIPTGSGNGFARHLGIPTNPRNALRVCERGEIIAIDTGEVNGLPFIGVMGLGFDAWIAHEFARHPERGIGTYIRAAFRGLRSYRPVEYEVQWRDGSRRHTAYVLTVANTSQYGNNAHIAPHASVVDGELDVVMIDDASMVHMPVRIARLFTGSFHRSRGVTSARIDELTIRRQSAGEAHVDGEPVHLPAELHVRVRPRSLRVLVPSRGKRL